VNVEKEIDRLSAAVIALRKRIRGMLSRKGGAIVNLRVDGAALRGGWFSGVSTLITSFDGILTAINIHTEIRKDTDFYSHASTSSDVIIIKSGWYRISYCVRIRNDLANRSCLRVSVYDDGAEIAQGKSQNYSRYNTYGRYISCSSSFIAEIAAGSILDFRTDGQSGTGAFGTGTCNYAVQAYSQFTIERIDE